MSLTKVPIDRARSGPLTSTKRRITAVAGVLALALVTGACAAQWGIRSSYRTYITGPIADGEITTTNGATWLDGSGTGKGPFQFPLQSATFDETTKKGSLQLAGGVRTVGHAADGGYILDLTVSNPRLEIDGNVGTLFVDLNYRPYVSFDPDPLPALEAAVDVAFATVDLSGVSWVKKNNMYTIVNAPVTGLPAAMQRIGWDVFFGSDVALDPFTASFIVAPPGLAKQPSVYVSQTTGLKPGDKITVWGSGFAPSANTGTRPPLAGQPSGDYVVFGKFANTWRPSQGAPSSARTIIAQDWALPEPSRSALDPPGTNPEIVLLNQHGQFKAIVTVGTSGVSGNYGVYVYAGSGAVNAAHEFATPVELAS